ncbi:RDD family protein [Fibrobacter sp.]|uniref:RDD family protein n=1 Tax=Fibrobacter sp. TaxID=35828 RepID=UPI00386CE14D
MIWYYIDETVTDGERRKGPYNIDEIRDFVKDGVIKDETLVWHSGMEAWVAWKDTEESKEVPLSEEEQIKAALEAIIAEHNKGKRYAGFFIRAIAYVVDNVILSAIGVLILMIMNSIQAIDLNTLGDAMNAYISTPTSEEALNKVIDIPGVHLFLVIWGVIQAVYFVAFTAFMSATPGKMLMKIHVEAAHDEKMNVMVSSIRFIASLITQVTLMFYGIGYLIVMVDPKRRALHDHIARTRVVYNRRQSVVSDLQPKDESKKDC